MEIKRTEVLDALNNVAPGLATKEVIEQTKSFVFKNNRVHTYNDTIAVSFPIDLDINGAVTSTELYKLLSKTKVKDISIEEVEGKLILKTKKMKASVKMDAKIVLPIDDVQPSDKWHKLPKDFLDALKYTIFSTSRDMTNPILNYIHIKDDFAEASDNFRITSFKLSKKMKEELMINYQVASEIVKYDLTHYQKNDNWIHFKNGNDLIFSCRTIADEFPNIQNFLNVKGVSVELPEKVIEIIERSQIFSNSDFDDEFIQITLKKNKMMFEAKSESGNIKESAKIKYDENKISFNVNPEFLKEISKQKSSMIISENMLKFETGSMQHVIMLISNK